MMHARSLVRRLLRLRKSGELLLNRSTEIGPNFATNAQSGADRKLRLTIPVNGDAGKGDGEHPVVQPDLRNGLGGNGPHMQRVGYFESVGSELNRRSSRFGIGHRVPLDELNQHFAGQLPFKSSGGKQ